MVRAATVTVGMLRERVTIQQRTEGVGRAGATFSTLATVWAAVTSTQPRPEETLASAAVTSTTRYNVTIRYRDDVNPKDRLSWTPYRAAAAKVLEIANVEPSADRAMLTLRCLEGTVQ